MERRRAQANDVHHSARGSAANIFVGGGDRTPFSAALSRRTDSKRRRADNLKRPNCGPCASSPGRRSVDARNPLPVIDDAGTRESIAREQLAHFPTPPRDAL